MQTQNQFELKRQLRTLFTEYLSTCGLSIQTHLVCIHKRADTKAHAAQQGAHPVDTQRQRE